jgi:DNA-binding transcriptional LysR family regulator
MDASEIEVFLTLAEELSFTRTAERLHVQQSRVSRLLTSLERRVGGALFERTSRKVVLTPLGEKLRCRAGPAYAELESALAEVRAAARNIEGTLRVGCTASTGCPAVTRLIEEFSARYPGCGTALRDVDVADPYSALRRGEIDVLVNWLAVDEPDLTAGPVLEYRDRVLLVGSGHRLAGRESVSAEDLGDEEVHENIPGFPLALYHAIVPPVTPAGRPIRRAHPWPAGPAELTTCIARGQYVHPSVVDVAPYQRGDIRAVPLRDLPPLPLGLIWCTAHENATIRALADVARRLGTTISGSSLANGRLRPERRYRPEVD